MAEGPSDSGVTYKNSRQARSVAIQVCEARNLPKLKGVFATVHVTSQMSRTHTIWKTKNPLWADEFNFDINDQSDVIKIFLQEDRKKGIQKKLGEIRLLTSNLPKNQKTEAWLPLTGDKAKTICDVRVKILYTVDVLLPTAEYDPFLFLLVQDDLEIVKLVSNFTRDKSDVARDLIHIFQARSRVEHLLGQLVKDEIETTDQSEVLFRANTVTTKAMDHYMKLVGMPYMAAVLRPAIVNMTKHEGSLEVDKNRMNSGDDWKKNMKVLTSYLDDITKRIFSSTDECPRGLRRLLALVDQISMKKFTSNPKVRYTAVGGFIFLRFFVPAILNPKLFQLMETLPDETQSRSFTLVAGVMQKLANLVKYRDQEQYMCNINEFLDRQFPHAKDFIDHLVDLNRIRMMQHRPRANSIPFNNIQVDQYLAAMLRHIEKVLPQLKAVQNTRWVEALVEVMGRLKTRVDEEAKVLADHEQGIAAGANQAGFFSEIDSLMSNFIQTALDPEKIPDPKGRRKTVKRPINDPLSPRAKRSQTSAPAPGLSPQLSKRKVLVPGPRTTDNQPGLNGLSSSPPNFIDPGFRPKSASVADLQSATNEALAELEDFKPAKRTSTSATASAIEPIVPPIMMPKHAEAGASSAPTSPREEEEEDEEEEVDVIEMPEVDFIKLQQEFDALEKVIDEIKSIPPPPAPQKKTPREVIPELSELDKVIDTLEGVIIRTTPKRAVASGISSNLTCWTCKSPVMAGEEYLIALDRNYHKAHLRCISCNTDVSDTGFQPANGEPYCAPCYAKAFDKRPRCAKCEKIITESEFVVALGKSWHAEHFSCTICGNNFADGAFYSVNGKPYCERHQYGEASNGDTGPVRQGVCDHCKEDIFDPTFIEAIGLKFHTNHFLCDQCGNPLEGTFVTYGGGKKACAHHFS